MFGNNNIIIMFCVLLIVQWSLLEQIIVLVVKNSGKCIPNSCNSFCASYNDYCVQLAFVLEAEIYTFKIWKSERVQKISEDSTHIPRSKTALQSFPAESFGILYKVVVYFTRWMKWGKVYIKIWVKRFLITSSCLSLQ